jgi:gliding motility-associated-like protein
MGGELTWTCQGTSYVFTMKFYRDCNGITGPTNPVLTTNVPGVPNIPLNQITLTDISPTGSNTSGTMPCPVCAALPGSGGGNGAVHEYVYRSAPVVLPGTPPPTGWVFSWGECCRSNALTNMVGAGGLSMGIRAVMYPYAGFIAGQCRDNSPFFAERPSVIICTGYPFTYNHNAIDNELDSLVYSWDSPVSEPPITPQAYSAGYSVTSPLPGPVQNPSNSPATLNTQNGEISFTSYTQGYFVTVVKVTAYKCNTKAAEIFREINVVLIAGCTIPVVPPQPNIPPTVTIINRKTGLPLNQNKDTVCVGDTLKLRIIASDPDPHPVDGVQSVIFTITGSELSNPANSPAGSCLIPPCAYTSANLPLVALFGTQMDFDWPIKCDHLGLDTLCTRISSTYNFVIKVKDNYCPAPAQNTNTLSITIKRCREIGQPEGRCASVDNPNGSVRLHWKPESPRDTFGLFHKYEIKGSLSYAGPYTVIDSIYWPVHNYSTNQILIPAIKLVNQLGYHAQDTAIYFKINTYSGCKWDSISEASNIFRTMKLHADTGQMNAAILTWNSVHLSLLPTSNLWYYIYREYPAGTWTLIDSVLHPHPPGFFHDTMLTYVDTFPRQLCNDIVVYRIRTSDSLYCDSWSSYDTIDVSNNTPIAAITPATPALCAGSNVNLTASPGGSVYQWSTGANTQAINVSTTGTYTVTITYNPGGCTATATATVQQVTPCTPTWSASPASYCAGGSSTLTINCAGGAGPPPVSYTYSYTNVNTGQVFGPFTTATLPINIPVSPTSTTTYQLTSFIANYPSFSLSCPAAPLPANVTITVIPLPTAAISVAGSATICEGQSTNLQFNFTGTGPWTYSYNSPSGVVGPLVSATTPVIVPVSPTGTFNYTLISTSNALCAGTISGSALVTVNTLPQASISGSTSICENQNATITINFSNAPGPYSITYNPGNVVVNNVNNPYTFNVSPSSTTNYTLVAVSNANCSGSVSGNANITVNALPTANIIGNPTICNGQQANLTVNFGGAPGPYNFVYNPGNVSVNGATNPAVITVNPASTTNYTLVSVSNANCAGTVSGSATVTVNQLPTAQLSGTQTICNGQQANLTLNFTGTGPWTYSYLVNGNPAGPFVANTSPAIITVTPGSNTTYTLPPSVSDANCTGTNTSGSAVVTVTPLPTAQVSGTTSICNGQQATITFDFTGQPPFVYSYSDGTNTFGPFNTNLNQVTLNVSPSATTSYTLVNNLTGNGCAGSVSGVATVTVNQLPDAAITGTTTICDGTNTNLTVTFSNAPGPYTFTYNPGNITVTNATNPATITVNPGSTTNYTLVSVSNANCAGTISTPSATVTVTPLPTATLSGTTSICNGNSANLTVNLTGQAPFSFSYTDGTNVFGPITTSNSSYTITVSPTVNTNYTLLPVVTGNNCNGVTAGSASVTVNQLPSALISGTPEICNGDQTTIEVAFVGVAPFTYRYSDGTNTYGPFVAASSPVSISVSPAVSTNYTLISVDDANCAGTVSGNALVTVHQLPTAQLTGSTTICEGDQASLNFTFNGVPPFTYSFSDGANVYGPFVANSVNTSVSVSPNATTTYSVITIEDAHCTGTVSGNATITVTPLPTASLSGTPTICNGQSASITVNFTGVAPFEYSYTDGTNTYGPFTTSANPVSISVSPSVTTNYTLTSTVVGAGCNGTTSGAALVTVNQLPDATVSGNSTICNGDQTSFNITFNGVAPFTYSYTDGSTIYGPFVSASSSVNIPVNPLNTTTYSVVLIADDNCTGTASGNATVTVNQLPQAQLSGTTAICDGSSTSIVINFTGTPPFTYSYSDGSATFGPYTTNNNPEMISLQPLVTTSYTLLSVTDANCTGSVAGNATISVNELPTAVISQNSEICIGQQTNFQVAFTGTAPFTFYYTNGLQTFGPVTTSDNPALIQVSPGVTQTYSLVSVTDANCPGSVSGSANVIVNPLPVPVITGTPVICDGDATTFDAGAGYVSYLWSNGQTTQTITVNVSGTYIVTVTDNNGCQNSDDQLLIVNQTPVVSFTNDTSLTCADPLINFINQSTYPPGSTFNWTFGTVGTSTLANPSQLFTQPGTYPVTLIITTQAGCSDTATRDVEIIFYPLPVAEFIANPKEAGIFNSKIQFTDLSQYAVSWWWDFGDGQNSAIQHPEHYYDEMGKFLVSLTVKNIAGCESTYRETVYITPFFVPNAFTPNHDGLNENFFEAGYTLDVSSYNMSIYNRWGQKVFENDSYNKPWNGLDKNGKPAPEGVYVYAIKVKTLTGKDYYYTGHVTLLR